MSGTQVTSLICNNFGGIRRKSAIFSDEKITCSDCQNIELFFTNLNSGVGIRTVKGNTSVYDFEGEVIIGLFASNQGGDSDIVFAYTEDDDYGYLWKCDILNDVYEKIDLGNNFSLEATGKACGVDFAQGWYNYFVFSNGDKFVYLYTDINPDHSDTSLHVDTTQPIDTANNTIKGLGIKSFDNRIWVFSGHTLYYSCYGNCTDFNTQDASLPLNSAGDITLPKSITAIAPYLGSLAVFYKESSCLIVKDDTSIYKIEDESPGGCASYDSLVFHGTDLYFYDDTKKGVFSFSQVVNGDKILSQNIAEDIQEELIQIPSDKESLCKIRALSVVTEDRNEVWFITPINREENRTVIFIFDYIRGEWVKRYSNKINCLLVYNADLYSGGSKLYKEYETYTFDGEYIGSYYNCSIFNYGSDNTLKITKFPPRITIDTSVDCDFWIEYIRNYNIWTTPKTKNIKGKIHGNILIYDNNMHYDSSYVYKMNTNAITKLPSVTFKTLEMSFKTKTQKQGFCIKNIEFSKLKIKQV